MPLGPWVGDGRGSEREDVAISVRWAGGAQYQGGLPVLLVVGVCVLYTAREVPGLLV